MYELSESEKVIFTKHLGVMVKAGIPLPDALASLQDDATTPKQRKLLGAIQSSIQAGESLTQALAHFPHTFDHIYLSLITIGEASGTLDETLHFLATQLSKLHNLRKKIQGALMYPALVVGLMAAVGIGLSIFVLPKLVDFFAAFDQTLPLPTQILLGFANLMKDHGLSILSILTAIILIAILITRITAVKKHTDRMIFQLPLIGTFLKISRIAELSRNLSILLTSGIPLVSGLNTLVASQTNLYLKASLQTLAHGLSQGKSLNQTITQQRVSVFPNLFSKMVAVGERTGKLDEMLMYLADYYEEEIENASKNLTTTLEPILLIIVGLLVGFMAIAIIGPIYQITGSIGG